MINIALELALPTPLHLHSKSLKPELKMAAFHFKISLSILLLALVQRSYSAGPLFAPYFDVTLDRPNLVEYSAKTGQKDFTLAFALGGTGGCDPMWGAQIAIDDPAVMGPIRQVIASGGEMVIATGGAVGPYLEHVCGSVEALSNAYKRVLDVVGTTHLDVDIEAPIDNNLVNGALAKVQADRPGTTVSYTVMIQGEDYGMVPDLGVEVLKNAKVHGVHVDLVNAMTMEFPGQSPDWGDSVINAAISTLNQMKSIWPEKPEAELRRMLGVTPMLGRNFNGKIFEVQHGRKLVDWANENRIGYLSFWSIGRDNGDCPGSLSPYCSGTIQEPEEFTRIFQGFNPPPPLPTTTQDPTAPTTTTTTTEPNVDCTEEGIGGIKCWPYFWDCVNDGNGGWLKYEYQCSSGLVYDPVIKGCNRPESIGCPAKS